MEGVALVGKPAKSGLYAWKEVPATTSADDLLASLPWRNPVVSSRKDSEDDPIRAQALWGITVGEVEKGCLEGPFE